MKSRSFLSSILLEFPPLDYYSKDNKNNDRSSSHYFFVRSENKRPVYRSIQLSPIVNTLRNNTKSPVSSKFVRARKSCKGLLLTVSPSNHTERVSLTNLLLIRLTGGELTVSDYEE